MGMNDPAPIRRRRKATNVSLDQDLVDEARALVVGGGAVRVESGAMALTSLLMLVWLLLASQSE